jgi:hypothetical protein
VRDHRRDRYCAIVGGYVVRDPQLAPLTGRYLYGDHCQTRLRSAALVLPPERVRDDVPAHLRIAGLNSFGEDACGHIYAASAGGLVGRIDGDRFVPCPGGGPSLRIAARPGRARVRMSIGCDRPCAARIADPVDAATTAPARRARVSLALPPHRAKVLIGVTAVDAAGNRTVGSAKVRVRQHVRHG